MMNKQGNFCNNGSQISYLLLSLVLKIQDFIISQSMQNYVQVSYYILLTMLRFTLLSTHTHSSRECGSNRLHRKTDRYTNGGEGGKEGNIYQAIRNIHQFETSIKL